MSAETALPRLQVERPSVLAQLRGWLANPWNRPRLLALWTWLYIAWSIVPIVIAVQFSFNAGRSRSTWQGFSLQWYFQDPDLSVLHDPSLRLALLQSAKLAGLSMLITTPLGVALALGLARWRGRGAKPANFLMLFPLVTPEIVMGVALFLVFTNLFDFVSLGTPAQLLGHVTFSLSFVVIIIRGRLFAIGREYEEAAMDLGATQWDSLRRVLLPLLAPAIFSALMIVFALSIDDFVITYFNAGPEQTFPVFVWGIARVAVPPQVNVVASAIFLVAIGIGLANVLWEYRSSNKAKGVA